MKPWCASPPPGGTRTGRPPPPVMRLLSRIFMPPPRVQYGASNALNVPSKKSRIQSALTLNLTSSHSASSAVVPFQVGYHASLIGVSSSSPRYRNQVLHSCAVL